ncbi:hypothetical protein [Streptomyces sp. NPDC047976]|uniref:hypothetical protein n=1 Tax=Streptomyces sp. NPDC047976 TaxID=3155746 RepID=UPI00342C5528
MATTNGLKRRKSALATALGFGLTLSLALPATPAHAQAILSIEKSHEGNFERGGQGAYTITLSNNGDEDSGLLEITDNLPTGLTVTNLQGVLAPLCEVANNNTTVHCDEFNVGTPFPDVPVLTVTVNVADNAPCSVVNTVMLTETGGGNATLSDSDQTTITGGDCDDGGGGGGSILPVNLNGVVTLFNNINTGGVINSPNGRNTNNQTFRLNAP